MRKFKSKAKSIIVLICILIVPIAAFAKIFGYLDMVGAVRVSANSRTGTYSIYVAQIKNLAAKGSISGSVEVSLWATKSRFSGKGTISGYKVGSCIRKAGIAGKQSFVNASCSGRQLRLMPKGKYNAVVLVSEYDGRQFLWEDYVNINGAITVP